MLAHPARRRLPVFLRQYATHGTAISSKSSKKGPNSPPPTPKSQPRSHAPQLSLRSRLLASGLRQWEQREKGDNEYRAKEQKKALATKSPPPEEEQQMQYMDALLAHNEKLKSQGRIPATMTLPLMDLMIPYAVNYKSRSEYPSMRTMYDQFMKNRVNDGKNAFSMRHIAVSNSFPGVTIPSFGWFRSIRHYMPRLFQAQSLKADAWVAPLRQEALDLYIKLNTCLAQGDSSKILNITMNPYTDEILPLVRKSTARGNRYFWNFHREVTPTRIVSIRATDGDFSKEMPATGKRLALQALVRFDTEQSVEIYDEQGRALHAPYLTADPQPARTGRALHAVPAERKRVTEYLVLDKAMYQVNAEWKFRAQFLPTSGRTIAV
ncbi:hypothetical protein B0H10DRAFT_1992438 [Mycena sp. CBHHK59/15]|nr:hypothetical protein B0H10DRAFT_1992438 [Mycena sp. CBHHK59/15]